METSQYGLARKTRADSDQIMKVVLLAVSCLAVLMVFLIIVYVVEGSWDAVSEIGILDFLLGNTWSPDNGEYGALPLITGTILVTIGAMAFAVPIGLAAAIYISENANKKFRNIIKPVCELFAGIPSVVYGFFGLIVLVPFLRDLFPDQLLFGNSWLAGSLVLGIMALPTIISVSEDAIHSVPQSYREASLAMGATRWETTTKVVVPAAISGISAAIILGVGRAIGETMAVMMVTGNSAIIPDPLWNVFSLISTITGTIALQIGEAGTFDQSALFGLGVILMIMVLVVNVVARSVIKRTRRKFGEFNAKDTLTYKLFKRESLLPTCFNSVKQSLADRKEIITQIFIYVLAFVLVWMCASLFTTDVQSLVAAAIAVVVLIGLKYISGSVKSTSKEMVANGALIAVMVFVVAILAILIGYIVINGLPAISWDFLTGYVEDGGREGGIFPAIVGTLELLVGTAAIAFPIGILTGIYLGEYAKNTLVTRIIREAIDLLNGTPSIVFGLFGMVFMVIGLGWGYSMIAGWITLSFMIIPVVIRTTEEALRAVPHDLREASRAMGASKWQTTYKVIVPAAMGGIITGTILSIGRASGETAPIMLTAAVGYQAGLATGIFDSVMALPYHLFYLCTELPSETEMQYGTALVLLVVVMIFFGVASLIRSHYNKKVKW